MFDFPYNPTFDQTFASDQSELDTQHAHTRAVSWCLKDNCSFLRGVISQLFGKVPRVIDYCVEHEVNPGTRHAIDIVVASDVGTLCIEVKAGYTKGWSIANQIFKYQASKPRPCTKCSIRDLSRAKWLVMTGYRIHKGDREEIRKKAHDVHFHVFRTELCQELNINLIDHHDKDIKWCTPKLSWVVESNSRRLVVARPNLALVLSVKESERLQYLKPGNIITFRAEGYSRVDINMAHIFKGYWADENHDRCNWNTRYQPNIDVRPCLYAHTFQGLQLETPNYVYNDSCYMRFRKDEFNRGFSGNLDIGYSIIS